MIALCLTVPFDKGVDEADHGADITHIMVHFIQKLTVWDIYKLVHHDGHVLERNVEVGGPVIPFLHL